MHIRVRMRIVEWFECNSLKHKFKMFKCSWAKRSPPVVNKSDNVLKQDSINLVAVGNAFIVAMMAVAMVVVTFVRDSAWHPSMMTSSPKQYSSIKEIVVLFFFSVAFEAFMVDTLWPAS